MNLRIGWLTPSVESTGFCPTRAALRSGTALATSSPESQIGEPDAERRQPE
jgi:hypothetical protein